MLLPTEVQEFLARTAVLRAPDRGINPLTPEQAIHESSAMQEIEVCEELGLIVLNDAQDSNPYSSAEPALRHAGSIDRETTG